LVGEEDAHVGEPEGDLVARVPNGAGGRALEVTDLPAVAEGDVGEREHRLGEGGHPGGGAASTLERVEPGAAPLEHLGDPADEVDGPAADVVERHDAGDLEGAVGGDGDAEQEPVETEAPGPLVLHLQGEGGPSRPVVAPPDAR